ncbi:Uncharacterized protein PHSC3_001103 [Chlamydiales bacterium STE3]|nr:Uncharacterized protein PHSC3_001103 [Chlamydiales bacterium STE3]
MIVQKDEKLSRIRFLTIALFISGSFNILLLAFLFYWAFQEKPPTPLYQLKPKTERALLVDEELLHRYRHLGFNSLIAELLKKNSSEERDLIIAALVSFYDFDIKRALSSSLQPLISQILICRNGEKILVFPKLEDEQCQLIIDFANKEKWPFKAKGLFQLLKLSKYKNNSSLIEAFTHTEEFVLVKNLFMRCSVEVKNEELLEVLLEGQWNLLASFCAKQKKIQDLSEENRHKFLFDFMRSGSKASAYLLLKTDWDFAINRLKDESIALILNQLENKSEELQKLSSAIIKSPRGETVRNLAEKRLEDYLGTKTVIQEKVLVKLKSKETPKICPPVKKPFAPKPEKVHIVQEGDSLWKIARKYHLEVEAIKKYNYLVSDLLQPGTTLRIPI